jgi:hypothetical protein
MKSNEPGRTVTAPPPSANSPTLPANRVLSVTLTADEEVEWIWTSTSDGTSYVSGYRILKHTSHDEPRSDA